jgi:pilus assembly protein Flp/PilA
MSAERLTGRPSGASQGDRSTDVGHAIVRAMLAALGGTGPSTALLGGAGKQKEGSMEHLMKMVVAIQLGFGDLRDKLRNDERGVTAVEYGLMVAAIAVAIIAIVFLLGGDLSKLFGKVDKSIAAKAS